MGFAKNLGSALNELATIVRPATIHRWIRERSGNKKKQPKRGRPRIVEQIETRIRKLGKNSGWGYTRILGELKKLGIESVTRNTTKNILGFWAKSNLAIQFHSVSMTVDTTVMIYLQCRHHAIRTS